jgi:tRNA (cmo5U34)-methyltransferase
MNLMQPFTDKEAVARYAEGPPRQVPGFADLQRMAMLLLAEKAPPAAEILVLGAGGGLELFGRPRPHNCHPREGGDPVRKR